MRLEETVQGLDTGDGGCQCNAVLEVGLGGELGEILLTFRDAEVCRPAVILAVPAAVNVIEAAAVLEVGTINGELIKGI